jgi:hypothetical protein
LTVPIGLAIAGHGSWGQTKFLKEAVRDRQQRVTSGRRPAIRTNGYARQLPTRLRHSNNVQAGEKPYLIVHVGLNRAVLLVAAGICVKFGSGGALRVVTETRAQSLRIR